MNLATYGSQSGQHSPGDEESEFGPILGQIEGRAEQCVIARIDGWAARKKGAGESWATVVSQQAETCIDRRCGCAGEVAAGLPRT